MDDAEALAAARASVAPLLRRYEAKGVDLYQAVPEAVMDGSSPRGHLAAMLRNARELLGHLPSTTEPPLFDLLDDLAGNAPPPDAPVEEHRTWASTVQHAMEERISAAGNDLEAVRDFGMGRPLEDPGGKAADLFSVMPELVVLTQVQKAVASLHGQAEVRRDFNESLEAHLLGAQDLARGGEVLRLEGPADQLIGPMLAAYVRAHLALNSAEGTRLRVALEARHGRGAADAVLAQELPGATEIARAEIGHAAAKPRSLITMRQLLRKVSSRAAKEVTDAQAPNHKHHGKWVVPLDIDDVPGARRHQSVEERALTEFELRERLSRLSATLTSREREVFICRKVDDLTGAETAEELGISANDVAVHLSHAMSKLRALEDPGSP